jgi:hypothetical protein
MSLCAPGGGVRRLLAIEKQRIQLRQDRTTTFIIFEDHGEVVDLCEIPPKVPQKHRPTCSVAAFGSSWQGKTFCGPAEGLERPARSRDTAPVAAERPDEKPLPFLHSAGAGCEERDDA